MTESNGDVVVVPGRFDRSPTLGKLAAAMARAQLKFLPIAKDKTANAGKFTYDYADLEACLQAVRPALNAEGIALFQPTSIRVDLDGRAWGVATTLLALEEEWISSEYASPVVDVTDAQACGSACTYARRYGGLGLFGVFPADEDDDAQAARGGAHEMAKSKAEPACPACGVIGSIMKGSPQYGGGILCWAKRGGCGVKWPEGTPFPPTEKPPIDPAPPASKGRAKKSPDPVAVAAEKMAGPGGAREQAAPAQRQAEMKGSGVVGSDDCGAVDEAGRPCWGPKNHTGGHLFEGQQGDSSVAVASSGGPNRAGDSARPGQRMPGLDPRSGEGVRKNLDPGAASESRSMASPGEARSGDGAGSSVSQSAMRRDQSPRSGDGTSQHAAGGWSSGQERPEDGVHPGSPAVGGEPVRGQDRAAVPNLHPGTGARVEAGGASAGVEAGEPVTRFKIGNAWIETAGMTEEQFRDSVILSTEIDKGPLGKGYAREILGKILGKPGPQSTRKELTFEAAEKYLAALRQAAAAGPGA